MGEGRWKNAGETRIAGDMEVVVDVLAERGMDVTRLVANEVAGVADVVPGLVVAFEAQGAVASASIVLHHDAIAVRAVEGVLHEDLALTALLWIVAGPTSNVLGEARRGAVVDDDFAHLLWHGYTSV